MRLGERLANGRTRWRAGLLLIFAINLFGLHFLLTPEDMTVGQENHDTRIMYKHLRYWNEPTKWLYGDWPLQNGFYRPLPALAFELDVRLWDKDFPKYKIFNWLVCVAASFLLVGFVLALAQSQTLALGTGALFSAWQTDLPSILFFNEVGLAAAITCLAVALKAEKQWRLSWIGLAAFAHFLGFEWANLIVIGDLSGRSFGYRTMGWPPGRTATLFGMFGLLCLWGYCNWERRNEFRWLVIAALGFVGAFMSYEQAVMLPAALLGSAIFLKLKGLKIHWAPHLVASALMVTYGWWHFTYLPIETRYATQHSSSISSGVRSLLLWIFPGYSSSFELGFLIDPEFGLDALILPSFWIACVFLVANVVVWVLARREWRLLAFGVFGSAIVFAPMAFQLRLSHYFYLPLALRAIYVTALTQFAWTLLRRLVRQGWAVKSDQEKSGEAVATG